MHLLYESNMKVTISHVTKLTVIFYYKNLIFDNVNTDFDKYMNFGKRYITLFHV